MKMEGCRTCGHSKEDHTREGKKGKTCKHCYGNHKYKKAIFPEPYL